MSDLRQSGRQYEIRTACVTITDLGAFLGILRSVMSGSNTTIICFNAGNMAGMRHARAALDHALRSFSGGSPIAKTLEMEALLYAAGTRQCADASVIAGIRQGENRVYVCCSPPRPEIWDILEPLMQFTDDDWERLDPEKKIRLCRFFSISDTEIAAAGGMERLCDLVIERVALLDAGR